MAGTLRCIVVLQDAPVDDEQLEAAAQRLAQQKARFQNALVDSVDRREAFQPTTYAEILEVRWIVDLSGMRLAPTLLTPLQQTTSRR